MSRHFESVFDYPPLSKEATRLCYQLDLIDKAITDANIVGELLLTEFFKNKKNQRPGHHHFEFQSDVKILPDEPKEWIDYVGNSPIIVKNRADPNTGEMWNAVLKNGIKMRMHGDGDMTIAFLFPNGEVVSSDDAKKDYCWKFYKSLEEWFFGEMI